LERAQVEKFKERPEEEEHQKDYIQIPQREAREKNEKISKFSQILSLN